MNRNKLALGVKTGAKIEAETDTRSPFPQKNAPSAFLEYPADGDGGSGALGEFGTADVEGVESICAVGAVLEQVFLGLGEFLPTLVLAEAVSATAGPSGLQGED